MIKKFFVPESTSVTKPNGNITIVNNQHPCMLTSPEIMSTVLDMSNAEMTQTQPMTFLEEVKAGFIPLDDMGAYYEYYVEMELEGEVPFWEYLGFSSQDHMDKVSKTGIL